MSRKKASLVIDLRDGVNIPKVADVTAVLAAAGWKVDLALKVYGGESLQLAAKASTKGYDVIIPYGGDGTVNQVVNGVMNAKGSSAVGVIPGGTANEWATESGIPLEPFQAALALVNSEPREVDLGYIGVQGLVFPEAAQSNTNAQGSASPQATQSSKAGGSSNKSQKAKKKKGDNAKHHFLLMAGLGVDAGVISRVSKALKYRVGQLAYAPAAVENVPETHPFPIELREVTGTGDDKLLWQGDAWQVIFGNTRLYAGLVELTPQAYVDDGQLDVCVIKSGNILTTAEEVVSLLFQRRSAPSDTENFRGARFSLRAPASIGAHIDGSVVELKDYLSKADAQQLAQAGDPEKVMVEYTFAAEPAAIHMNIPLTYSGELFSKPLAAPSQGSATPAQQPSSNGNAQAQPETAEQVNALVAQGTKVTVVGVGPNPDKQHTYIIAGTTQNEATGDTSPVAVRVNDKTAILRQTGEPVTLDTVQTLQEGAEIVAEGKKNKRGAIKAAHLVLL